MLKQKLIWNVDLAFDSITMTYVCTTGQAYSRLGIGSIHQRDWQALIFSSLFITLLKLASVA